MEQMCGGTIPSQDRYRQVTFRYDSSNITHRDCKVRVNPGALKLRDGGMMYSKTGFLIVFQEVNLFNLDCGQANLSVTKGIYYYGSDYDYIDNLPNPNIPGEPNGYQVEKLRHPKIAVILKFEQCGFTIE